MQRYMKNFEEIIIHTKELTISSSTIHQLANQFMWQKPMERILIIEAKFYSLTHMYMTFFRQQDVLNEKTLNHLTSTIPSDALMIRYAYHTILECTTNKNK